MLKKATTIDYSIEDALQVLDIFAPRRTCDLPGGTGLKYNYTTRVRLKIKNPIIEQIQKMKTGAEAIAYIIKIFIAPPLRRYFLDFMQGNIDDMPLYINDSSIRGKIALWRLKKGK